jgi:hypothetical protein
MNYAATSAMASLSKTFDVWADHPQPPPKTGGGYAYENKSITFEKAPSCFRRGWASTRLGVVFALLLWLTGPTLFAQTQVQVIVNVVPPYSPYLQDYPGDGQKVRITLVNTSGKTLDVRFLGSLTGDNGVSIKTLPNYRPIMPLTLPPGSKVLSRTDLEGLFDLNQIEVEGMDKNTLYRGFPLPEGNYQLCVQAFDNRTSQPLSAQFPLGCSTFFTLKAVEPPILISPLCDGEVTPTTPQAVVFTWTPPAGVSPAQVDYTLRIVELPQIDVDPNVFIDQIVLPKTGLEVKNLRTSTFLYGPTAPPLTVGKRYAWRVQAIDRSGKLNFQNDGKSPVCVFTYGSGPALIQANTPGVELAQTPVMPIPGLGSKPDSTENPKKKVNYSNDNVSFCFCKNLPQGGTTVDNSKVLAQKSATIAGGFPLTFLNDVKEDPKTNTLSGTVMVPMPIVNSSYAKVRCRLVDVQCNASGEVIGGYVQAIHSDKVGVLPAYTKPDPTPPALTSDQISNMGQFWDSYKEGLVSEANNAKQSVGWEVPFGIEKGVGGFGGTFTITDLTLTVTDAYFNANMWISVPEVAKFKGIPLSANHVCIKWNGSGSETCGDKVLYLADKVDIGAGQLVLSLKGPADVQGKPDPNTATSVTYDEKGLVKMHLVAGLTSPVLKRKTDGQGLELLLTHDLTKTDDFKNWTAEVSTADDFYVIGLNDFTFSLKDETGKIVPAIYDHSDLSNPGAIPTAYEPGKDPTWHGLFLPQLSLSLPFLKSLHNGNDVPVGVKNMIFDSNGFTGVAYAGNSQKPLIALGDGSLDGWYCSTDQLSLTFAQSSFVAGGLNGKVVLPIFKYNPGDGSEKASAWPWTCTYTKANSAFEFVVTPPPGGAHTDIWKADLTILDKGKINPQNVTAIRATYKDGAFNAKAVLNMTLSLNTGVVVAPGMGVEGLTFQTSPPAGQDYFDPGMFTAGLNSPQRYIGGDDENSGLPLELTKVGVAKAKSNKTGEYDINLTGGLNLTKISSIHASATAYVRFRVGKTAEGRPDWGYVTTGLTSASVAGSLGPITLNGGLKLFGYDGAEDSNYGKGVKADLTVTVLGADFGSSTLAGYFGSKGDAKGANRFTYWQVGGFVDLGKTGVPIAPAVNMRKFGGGAFNNMKLTLDTTAKGEPTGNVSFVPSKGSCGFQAGVGVTTTDGTALGLTGRLTVELTNCSGEGELGIGQVAIDANAQLLVGDSPLAEGRGVFSVLFNNNKPVLISGAASLKAGYSAGPFFATGTGQMGLHIDLVDKSNFYFYLGKPISDGDRVTVTMGVKGVFQEEFGTYFFMGKADLAGITKLPPNPYKVDPALLKQLGYVGGSGVPANALAFGAGLNFEFNDSFGPFYLDFSAQVGYDLVLKNELQCVGDPAAPPGTPASQSYQPGINGWYANGQIYAALDLTLGIEVDLWFYSGRLEALKITAAALLEGGMVNPVWMHGSVLLKYRVLAGRIRGKVQAEFWYQKNYRCVVAMQQPNPFANMPIISTLLPTGKDPIPTITPFYAQFNYPIKTLIEVNEVDANSQPLDTYRTFRLDFIPGQEFSVTAKGGSGGGQYTTCENTTSGRTVFDQTGGGADDDISYNATRFRDAALLPNTSYSLTVGIQVNISAKNCDGKNCGKSDGKWAQYLFAGKNGKQKTPENVADTKTVEFLTGNCISTLIKDGDNANVSYSFPFEGQRYFTIGDAKQGFVELEAISCCGDKIKSDANFDLSVRMVPMLGGFNTDLALAATNVKFDGLRLSYTLPPALKRQQLYRLDVVRVPNENFVKAQLAELQKQKDQLAMLLSLAKQISPEPMLSFLPSFTSAGGSSNQPAPPTGSANISVQVGTLNLSASAKPGAGLGPQAGVVNGLATGYLGAYVDNQQLGKGALGNTTLGMKVTAQTSSDGGVKIKITPEQQAASIKKKYEQILYSYVFQTSQYNTLADKLKDTQILNNQVQVATLLGVLPDGIFTMPMQGKEGFDTFELDWELVGKMGKVRPPMVIFKPDDPVGNPNAWYSGFVTPTINLINAIATATKANGQKLFTTQGPGSQQYGLQGADYDQLMRSLMSINYAFDKPQPPISKAELIKIGAK